MGRLDKRIEEQAVWHYRKRCRRLLWWATAAAFFFLLAFSYYKLQYSIPNKIRIIVDETEQFDFGVPMKAEFSQDSVGVLSVNDSNIPSGSLHLDLQNKFTLKAEQTGSYTINLKLFGFIQLKQISLDVIEQMEAVPCGMPIGITLDTKGALVLGTGVVASANEGNVEPAAHILKTGDYIVAVDGKTVDGKEELIESIQSAGKENLLLTIVRDGQEQVVKVRRVRTAAGDYKLGIWVRDDTQGIGTLTYITTDGSFAALGHGISDVDTGVLMEAARGEIYEAEIVSITRGRSGTPGELAGVIRKSDSTRLGEVYENNMRGVFGHLYVQNGVVERLEKASLYGVMDIGLRQEVVAGPATILCQVDGTLREYAIEIENIDYSNVKQSKGLVIHITDQKLLEKTGGIVQGMSGSPIIQNGKLIGAVTHVFVRDSTRGYGTFIENMLENVGEKEG